MYRLPVLSTATPRGFPSCADVAFPPSPEKQHWPFPATVVIIPLGEILRMRWLSGKYTLPARSTARSPGPFTCALRAGPPSPEVPTTPLPAIVVMIPADEILRIRLPPATNIVPLPSTATPYEYNSASVADPPSPRPLAPPPATVTMIPLGETLRMRLPGAIKRLPAPSAARPNAFSCALVAGPPSPE